LDANGGRNVVVFVGHGHAVYIYGSYTARPVHFWRQLAVIAYFVGFVAVGNQHFD